MALSEFVPEDAPSRRRALKAIGAGIGGGVLESLVLPSATESPPTDKLTSEDPTDEEDDPRRAELVRC